MKDTVQKTALRDLVAERLDRHYLAWAADHPHLARAIDRVQLVDTTVTRLRDDPEFVAAMRDADLDEHRLARAAKALEVVERWATRVVTL